MNIMGWNASVPSMVQENQLNNMRALPKKLLQSQLAAEIGLNNSFAPIGVPSREERVCDL